MSDQVSTENALALVNSLHEWVIALQGASFDPAAIMEADRAAIEALEAGLGHRKALDAGKSDADAQIDGERARRARGRTCGPAR